MASLQIENLCLFCAAQCSPKFILQYDGKLAKLKTEGNNVLFLNSTDNCTEELLLIEEDLKAVFIVRQLLNIPSTDSNEYLGKYDGQHRPGYWFPICELCDSVVYQCFQCYREIAKLEKALEAGKLKLKRQIFNSTTNVDLGVLGQAQGLPSVWKSIRTKVNASNFQIDNDNADKSAAFNMSDGFKSGNYETSFLPESELSSPTPTSPVNASKKIKYPTLKIKVPKSTPTRSRAVKRKKSSFQIPPTFPTSPTKSQRHQPGWSVTTVTDEQLQNDWRIRSAHHLATSKLVTYYCYHGGRNCGARLKKRVCYNSNKVIIESNNVVHSNHSEKDIITEEQKQFILESFSKNIAKPRYILSNFQKTGVASPTKMQLRNYLAYCRRNNVIQRTALTTKLTTHLTRKLKLQSKSVTSYVCEYCGKKFESISYLKRHKTIAHRHHQETTTIQPNAEKIDVTINIKTENQHLPFPTVTNDENGMPNGSEHENTDENALLRNNEHENDPLPKSRGRGRPRGKTIKKPVIGLIKGNRRNWTVIPTLTDEELQNNWSIRGSVTHSDCKLQIFYCWFGRRKCGARLKKRVFHTSGEVIMEKNDVEHSNHREKSALTIQQKQLILDSLSDKIYQPKDILSVFHQRSIPSPRKEQVKSFLARHRKLHLVRNSRLGGTLYLSAKEHCTGTEENPFVCQNCDDRFKTIMALEVHQSENHQDLLGITPIICELCGLSTGSTRYFEFHKKSNCLGAAKPGFKHLCKICGKGFNDKKGLMAHMKGIMHKDADEDAPSHFQYVDGAYVCNYCGERFIRGIKIVTHMKAMHEDKTKTEFRCEGCLLVFDKLRLLLYHRKICESLGGDGGEARKAAKIKKAEEAKAVVKVIRCKNCKMEFSSYKICFTHKKKAHPELFSNHMCDSCGRNFMTLYRLTKHKKLCTAVEEEAVAGPSSGGEYLKPEPSFGPG